MKKEKGLKENDKRKKKRSLTSLILHDFLSLQKSNRFPSLTPSKHSKIRNLKKQNFKFWALLIFDFIISQVLIGPLITICWRSVWSTLEIFSQFSLDRFEPWLTLATGLVMMNVIHILMTKHQMFPAYFCLSKLLFTTLVFFSSTLLYKGWWQVCLMLHNDFMTLAILLSAVMTALIMSGYTRTIMGFPLVLSKDEEKSYFRLRRCQTHSLSYSLVLTSFVELQAITGWFAVWGIEDKFAQSLMLSPSVDALFSFVFGVALAILVFLFQLLLLRCLADSNESQRENVRLWGIRLMSVLGLLSTVSSLRGIWHLLDLYFLPENRILSLNLPILLAVPLLKHLGVLSSLHAGVASDESEYFLVAANLNCTVNNIIELYKNDGKDSNDNESDDDNNCSDDNDEENYYGNKSDLNEGDTNENSITEDSMLNSLTEDSVI